MVIDDVFTMPTRHELQCVQREVIPPERHIYALTEGVGEQIGDWFCTVHDATLTGVSKATGVSQHNLVIYNQSHKTAKLPQAGGNAVH